MRCAAIDMGTNSTRLLVADVVGSGAEADVKTLERLMTITRLGEGVARLGDRQAEVDGRRWKTGRRRRRP